MELRHLRQTLRHLEAKKTLARRLADAGVQSTRLAVLTVDHPELMKPLVERIERLSKRAEGDDTKERAFDSIGDTWYLRDVKDDKKAIAQLKADLTRIEKIVNA